MAETGAIAVPGYSFHYSDLGSAYRIPVLPLLRGHLLLDDRPLD
jgi:hypothetical protein